MSRDACRWTDLLSFLEKQTQLNKGDLDNIRSNPGGVEQPTIPLVMKLFAGIGGWLAAIFLISFLGVSRLITFDSAWGLWLWGLLFCAAAVPISRLRGGLFQKQLGLALGVAGYALVLTGAGVGMDSLGGIVLTAFVLTLGLYPLNRDEIYRFLAVGTVLVLTVVWCVTDHRSTWLLHGLIILQAGILVTLWKSGPLFRRLLPLVYALTVGLSFSLTIGFYPDQLLGPMSIFWWPSQLFLSVWLGYLLLTVWKQAGQRAVLLLTGLLLATAVLGLLSSPGILASVGILIMAQARRDRWLSLLGILGFALFVFFFYYMMALPLDEKSYLLMGSGALLLTARFLLIRVKSASGGEA